MRIIPFHPTAPHGTRSDTKLETLLAPPNVAGVPDFATVMRATAFESEVDETWRTHVYGTVALPVYGGEHEDASVCMILENIIEAVKSSKGQNRLNLGDLSEDLWRIVKLRCGSRRTVGELGGDESSAEEPRPTRHPSFTRRRGSDTSKLIERGSRKHANTVGVVLSGLSPSGRNENMHTTPV